MVNWFFKVQSYHKNSAAENVQYSFVDTNGSMLTAHKNNDLERSKVKVKITPNMKNT